MDYSDAKRIISKYNFNFAAMDEAGELDLYESYNVPPEVEDKWGFDKINVYIDSINSIKKEQAEDILMLMRAIFSISRYITDDQIILLYNAFSEKVKNVNFLIEKQCYSTYYSIMAPHLKADKLNLIEILKKISNRYKEILNSSKGSTYREMQRQSLDFYEGVISKYSR